MSIKVVATIETDPDQQDAVDKYFSTVLPMLDGVGAKIVDRMEIGEVVVGKSLGASILIVEYPNMEALEAVFGSSTYKKLMPTRDLAFRTYNINVLREPAAMA